MTEATTLPVLPIMACPVCGQTFEWAKTVQGLTICACCFASVVVATGLRATGADTLPLSHDELKELKTMRAQLRADKEVAP